MHKFYIFNIKIGEFLSDFGHSSILLFLKNKKIAFVNICVLKFTDFVVKYLYGM